MSARSDNQAIYMQTRTSLPLSWVSLQRILIFLISASVIAWAVFKLQQPDTLPIEKIHALGSFTHVNEAMLRNVVAGTIDGGYFAVNVSDVQEAVERLPWVYSASVSRIWPDTISINVKEQQAMAIWNGGELVNYQGTVFIPPRETFPANLPEFNGPAGMERNMTEFYQQAKRILEPVGVAIRHLNLDSRGAYTLHLNNGIKVLLGREQMHSRLERFARVYKKVLQVRATEIARIDMRYSNGLSVGWRNKK